MKNTIYASTWAELKDRAIYIRTWMIYRNLVMKQLSRRKLLDDMSIVFAKAFQDYDIRSRDGEAYDLPDLDEVFGEDPDMRWLSYFLEKDGYKDFPRRFTRKLYRLEVLILYIKVTRPHFAHHLEHSKR